MKVLQRVREMQQRYLLGRKPLALGQWQRQLWHHPTDKLWKQWGQVVVLRMGQPGSQALRHRGPVVGRVQLGLVFCAAGRCQTSRLL